MSAFTPYTYIQCPCCDLASERTDGGSPIEDADDDNYTFDPRAPRSNYGLYPLEYLWYCTECHQIRCPRCVYEEINAYYCPCCLFEVPQSNLKTDGNRCTRNCFQCPVCIGPLAVASAEKPPDPNRLAPDMATDNPAGPYILICSYCNWTSSEIGIQFEKSNNIHAQLARLRNGGRPRLTGKERKDRKKVADDKLAQRFGGMAVVPEEAGDGGRKQRREDRLDIEVQYANLLSFYQRNLGFVANSKSGMSSALDIGFGSPSSIARLMSLHHPGAQLKSTRKSSRTIQEALDSDEGLQIADLDESEAIAKLHAEGIEGTITTEQRINQPSFLGEPELYGRSRFCSELRPIPYLLRTKRAKKCRSCGHSLSKPEPKVNTTRFRYRLVAADAVPEITVKSLGNNPAQMLEPHTPVQFLLTFQNPIFERVRVTLGTPATTPGRFPCKVTLLCPQFEIGANMDDYQFRDDPLLGDGDAAGEDVSKDAVTAAGRQRADTVLSDGGDGQPRQTETGKVWDQGRNWVSIVVEVVPGPVQPPLREDEDVLEIPVFVRMEWEPSPEGAAPSKERDAERDSERDPKDKRELAYWCSIGLGRIRTDDAA